MALTEIMEMPLADLQFLVNSHNGALGSTGTGSGNQCDATTVHCCYKGTSVIQIQTATPLEAPSGYKLVIGSSEFAIGLETV